jgi:DNA-directed RNA polymerase specialized sigma24 family protein
VTDERNLKIEWHVMVVKLKDSERAAILERLPRLEKAVRDLSARDLHIEVDHNVRKGGFGVAMHLGLPRRSLYAADWSLDVAVAGRKVLHKLVDQVITYRSQLRRFERRSLRHEPQVEVAETPGSAARAVAPLLERLRPRIARLVRHEIVHDPSLVDIPKESISVPDVVDEAIVWTLDNIEKKPPFLTPEQYLWRRVLHQFDLARSSVIRRRDSEVANDRIEASHVEKSPEVDMEWEDAQDLLFGGGEPLPMDMEEAPASASDPGSALDREALQIATSEALRDLPEVQRRAVLLHDLEGYDAAEIAYLLHRGEDQVRHDLDLGHRALRRRLRGFDPR